MFLLCFVLAGLRMSVHPPPYGWVRSPCLDSFACLSPLCWGCSDSVRQPWQWRVPRPQLCLSVTLFSNSQWETSGGPCLTHSPAFWTLSLAHVGHHWYSLHPDLTWAQHWRDTDGSWGVSWASRNVSDGPRDPSSHLPGEWPKDVVYADS